MLIDQGTVKKRVDEIVVGDMIDLEDDEYADPGVVDDDETGEPRVHGRVEFTFEFATVNGVERETPGCIVLHTSMGSFGFPPDHLVECFV